VATVEQRRRQIDAKSLCRLQIDRKIIFGRSLHREIARILTFKNTVYITSRASKLLDAIRPVENQPAAVDTVPVAIYGRKSVLAGDTRPVDSVCQIVRYGSKEALSQYAYNGSIVVRIDIGVSSPRNMCSPSGRQGPAVASAKGAVASSGQPSFFVRSCTRTTSLTADPTSVNCNRSGTPTLP
jgi:hypothetical protein